MKVNSYILVNFEDKSSLNYDLSSSNIFENTLNASLLEVKSKKNKITNYLSQFWKSLIHDPLSLNQNHNVEICRILETETELLISESIKVVLSRELELPLNSNEISKAIEDSVKIFHEDYPYDFILEYNGRRLGMMLLDKCRNSNGVEEFIYKFNPDIKTFRGLF